MSQPSWAAWIEIFSVMLNVWFGIVAALLGCVDWNVQHIYAVTAGFSRSPLGLRGLKWQSFGKAATSVRVAALLGCVDWNLLRFMVRVNVLNVAALLGCVDWNTHNRFNISCKALSQPSWAAWIEINFTQAKRKRLYVAALLGCVDWNKTSDIFVLKIVSVAALLGCVDWNFIIHQQRQPVLSRSPLGLRGLKCFWST